VQFNNIGKLCRGEFDSVVLTETFFLPSIPPSVDTGVR
jgi:hypothetical protein